jgi:hypothetical protein
MKVYQYAYLLVTSTELDPGILSERIGLMPDRVKLMGFRQSSPKPIPRFHMWQLDSGVAERDVPLADHLSSLAARLNGSAARLRTLVDSGEAEGVVSVVRRFEPGPADLAPLELPTGFERLSGQHRLLGFAVPPELVSYIVAAGISLDFDEYGDEEQ